MGSGGGGAYAFDVVFVSGDLVDELGDAEVLLRLRAKNDIFDLPLLALSGSGSGGTGGGDESASECFACAWLPRMRSDMSDVLERKRPPVEGLRPVIAASARLV